jgi:hypothetical protein
MTVFRRLKELNSLSSFTHSRRYCILESVILVPMVFGSVMALAFPNLVTLRKQFDICSINQWLEIDCQNIIVQLLKNGINITPTQGGHTQQAICRSSRNKN